MTAYKQNTSNRLILAGAHRWFSIAVLAGTAFSNSAAAAGEATYKAKCVGCHGADGSGTTAMGKKFKLRDLRGADVQKRSDEDLSEVIVKGKPPMPAFGKTLEGAQVTELVTYLRSIATK